MPGPLQTTLVSGLAIAAAITEQTGGFFAPKDEFYHLTTEEFIAGPFTEAYSDFLRMFDLETYVPDANDCDKFSLYSRAVAQALNARTIKATGAERGALAFGCWDYRPSWASGEGHEIDVFCVGVPVSEEFPSGIKVCFYDALPTMRKIVTLSKEERESAWSCAQ